jgi:UDP-glucose 4-epimerase
MALRRAGARVRVLTRSWPPANVVSREVLAELEVHHGDIRDEVVVEAAVRGADLVFHLAGKSGSAVSNASPVEDLDVNLRGLINVLVACKDHAPSARLIFPSSRLVYAPEQPLPIAETSALGPISIYGTHKLAAERYLEVFRRESNLSYVVLRITNPYGPFQRREQHSYGIINWFIWRALNDLPLQVYGEGSQLRDYVHADDVVEAMLLSATSPAADGMVFNVGGGGSVTFSHMAELVAAAAGSGRLEHIPWPDNQARVETGDFAANISLIKRTLGWAPTRALDAGIAGVIQAYRKLVAGRRG